MKKTIKMLSVLMCVLVLTMSVSVSALESSREDVSLGKEARMERVFLEQIAIMEANHLALHPEEAPLSLDIAAIKEVADFAGNMYTLVELSPKGYILFHNESGLFIEYSSRSESPYLNCDGELYYAGIKEYYHKEESNTFSTSGETVYRHTVTADVLREKDIAPYRELSNEIQAAFVAEKNENIVSYIQNNTELNLDNTASSRTTTYNDMTVVKDYNFLSELRDCGYTDIPGGGCGYIAAGILLAYRQYAFGETCVPDSYIGGCVEVRLNVSMIPNNAGPQVTATTNVNKIYYTLLNSSNAILAQGSVNSSSNTWDFSQWSLAAGYYKLELQAPGGYCETVSFTKGSSGVITNMRITPNDRGPRVKVTTNGNKIYYTLTTASGSVRSQGTINGTTNEWDYSQWALDAGRYTLQVQANSGNCETYTFTVNRPHILETLPTLLYNKGVELGYDNETTSRVIRLTVKKYLSDRGYEDMEYIDEINPIANRFRIANCIQADKPVIWFGTDISSSGSIEVEIGIGHAVVVYGYDPSWGTYHFLAHFGWPFDSEIYFNGLLGSIYTCWRG